MGHNINTGTAGIVGDDAKGNQVNIGVGQEAPQDLAGQLATLRTHVKAVAETSEEIEDLLKVTKAAETGDVSLLGSVGGWVKELASKLGLTLIVEGIKNAVGLGSGSGQ